MSNRIAPPIQELSENYTSIPGESAEILEKRIHSFVDVDFSYRTSVYIAIRINDQNAIDDYSQIDIHYNDYFENLDLDYANVLTLEGKVASVKSDAIQIKTESRDTFYVDSKILAFSLPLTYSGSIIEYQYTVTQKRPIIKNEFFDSSSFNHWKEKSGANSYRLDYVHYSEYLLETPEAVDINFHAPGNFKITYKKNHLHSKTSHKWFTKNLPKLTLQNYIPRELEIFPRLKISTIKTWKDVSEWASELIEPKIDSTHSIKKIAQDIRSQAESKQGQILSVFNYMQENIRYVFAHVGRGGYEPHSTENIISNGYGDCKDQSVLTIALLRELGIKAYPALVSTSNTREPDKEIPQINFDHMITYIPEQNGVTETWIDTVGGNLLFPGISDTVNQRTALIIFPYANTLDRVNNAYSKPNLITMEIVASAPKNNQQSASFVFSFEGDMESNVRSWLRYASDEKEMIERLILAMYTEASIDNVQVNNRQAFEKEISFSGDMHFPYEHDSPNPPFGFHANTTKLANAFGLLPTLDHPSDRIYPAKFDIKYVIRTQTSIEKPNGYINKEQTSKEIQSKNKQFTYSHLITDLENTVTVSQELEFHGIDVTLDDYETAYKSVKSAQDNYWLTILSYDERKSNLNKLSSLPPTKKTEQQYIEFIQLLLDNGEYEQALEQAKTATGRYPNSGNIVYLKGLSHAYVGDDESANIEFKKSEELGYEI